MFFIKHHGKRVDLAEHEVYTYCPQCGKVHTVDLIEMHRSYRILICSAQRFIAESAAKRTQIAVNVQNCGEHTRTTT